MLFLLPLAHPENLPDAEELADPGSWLARSVEDVEVPDDVASLLDQLGAAPTEASAEERAAAPEGSDDAVDGEDDAPQDASDEAGPAAP